MKDVSDHFKMQDMCDNAARDYLFALHFVFFWFIAQQQIDMWHDDNYVYNDNEIIRWYDGYKKRKAQNVKISSCPLLCILIVDGLVCVRRLK